MRILCLQHSALGGEIHLPSWARSRGHAWGSLIVPEVAELPRPDDVECLVVLGGPMSAWDEEAHPWLEGEKRLIEALIGAGRHVLGICLGAQLLADVLGARTYRGPHREIGWFEVRATRDAAADPVGGCLPDAFETFLWHGDSFDLPHGAVHLAGSSAFAHQAFRWRQVLALQFHLEVRPDWVQRIAGRDAAQLTPARHVQPAQDILGRPEALYRDNNRLMDRLLDAWLDHALGKSG